MDEYKPNSNKVKEERPTDDSKQKKIIVGSAKVKKTSEAQKLASIFMPSDMSSVGHYILMDVLVPTIKKAISEVVKTGIDMILYDNDSPKSSGTTSKISYTPYNSMTKVNRESKSTYQYDEIVLANRSDAEAILMQMDDIVAEYGCVSVGDLYDMAEIKGNYTDNNYGWTDTSSAKVVRVRDGWFIKLPRARALD